MNIQEAFNIAAGDYDNLRRILIPCFDNFYKTAVEIIPGDVYDGLFGVALHH